MKNNRKNRKLYIIRVKNKTGVRVSNSLAGKFIESRNSFNRRFGYPPFSILDGYDFYPPDIDWQIKAEFPLFGSPLPDLIYSSGL